MVYRLKKQTLIKLHGCVKKEEKGYDFDEKEYIVFWNDDDFLFRDFGDAFSKGDMIFIGTEFQEDDLKIIIGKYTDPSALPGAKCGGVCNMDFKLFEK